MKMALLLRLFPLPKPQRLAIRQRLSCLALLVEPLTGNMRAGPPDRSGGNGYYLRFDQTTPFTTCSFTKACGLRIYKGIVDDNTPPGPFEGDGYICYDSPGQAVRCKPSFETPPEGYQPLNCVTTSDGVLRCSTSEGASINNACARTVGRVTDTNVWVLDFASIEGCSRFTISAVPVGQ
jgi:hypothetical protein